MASEVEGEFVGWGSGGVGRWEGEVLRARAGAREGRVSAGTGAE